MEDKIRSLRLKGLSFRQIASEVGCSISTVSYYLTPGQKEKNMLRGKGTRHRRNEAVAEMKKVPCADCGGVFGYWCMDFDHVRGEKVDTVSNLLKYGTWQQVLDEIAKCDVVCSNCHRTRTRERGYDTWA